MMDAIGINITFKQESGELEFDIWAGVGPNGDLTGIEAVVTRAPEGIGLKQGQRLLGVELVSYLSSRDWMAIYNELLRVQGEGEGEAENV